MALYNYFVTAPYAVLAIQMVMLFIYDGVGYLWTGPKQKKQQQAIRDAHQVYLEMAESHLTRAVGTRSQPDLFRSTAGTGLLRGACPPADKSDSPAGT